MNEFQGILLASAILLGAYYVTNYNDPEKNQKTAQTIVSNVDGIITRYFRHNREKTNFNNE